MDISRPLLTFFLIISTLTATKVDFVSSGKVGDAIQVYLSNWSGINLSVVELFILVFCFLLAVVLVVWWRFYLQKKR
jgi:hypothetical protein